MIVSRFFRLFDIPLVPLIESQLQAEIFSPKIILCDGNYFYSEGWGGERGKWLNCNRRYHEYSKGTKSEARSEGGSYIGHPGMCGHWPDPWPASVDIRQLPGQRNLFGPHARSGVAHYSRHTIAFPVRE